MVKYEKPRSVNPGFSKHFKMKEKIEMSVTMLPESGVVDNSIPYKGKAISGPYGKLTPIGLPICIRKPATPKKPNGYIRWFLPVRCECGTEKLGALIDILSGRDTSCGCGQREAASRIGKQQTTHGLSKHPLFSTWANIMKRCYDSENIAYRNYGARGISAYPDWCDPVSGPGKFIDYVEKLPNFGKPKMSLDRRDNDKNYEPGNLRWATPTEQCENQRTNRILTHRGKSQPLSAWARELGIYFRVIRGRLDRGWSVADALDTPVFGRKTMWKYNGKDHTLDELLQYTNNTRKVMQSRLDRGWPVEKALVTPVISRVKT